MSTQPLYVLACVDFDQATQTCITQQWVVQPSWRDGLPTLDQAANVGGAFFITVVGCAALLAILKPRT